MYTCLGVTDVCVDFVQEQNSTVNQRVLEMETETLQLQQHISKVDHQNAKLTEVPKHAIKSCTVI